MIQIVRAWSLAIAIVCAHAHACAVEQAAAPPDLREGLAAFYFDNQEFGGPSVKRVDSTVDFTWGDAAPATGIAPHTFSVWWTGYIAAPVSGVYGIRTISDDGIAVRIGGNLVIENWTYHGSTTDTGSAQLEGGKLYPIDIRYFDGTGSNVCRLQWQVPGGRWETVPSQNLFSPASASSSVPGNGQGLRATFYAGKDLSGAIVDGGLRVPFVEWGDAPPAVGFSKDGWSSAWAGSFEPQVTGTYLFSVQSDDGVSVFVDGKAVIEAFLAGAGSRSFFVTTVAGQKRSLRIMHREESGPAYLRLSWLSAGMDAPQPVPSTQLFAPEPVNLEGGSGAGLATTYYPNPGFSGVGTPGGTDAIQKWWGGVPPLLGYPLTGWSVVWDGEIEAPVSDLITLTLASNDSAVVEFQGKVVLNHAARHGFATASTAPMQLVEGKRYRLTVRVANFKSTSTGAVLWWSGELFAPRVVPRSRLYPGGASSGAAFVLDAPKASRVNPAWVPYAGEGGSVAVAVDDRLAQVVIDAPGRGYVSTQQKPAGITLAQDHAVAFRVVADGEERSSGSILWEPTDLAFEDGYVPLVVRIGDRLLITDSRPGGTWTYDTDKGGSSGIRGSGVPGERVEVGYQSAGVYRIASAIDGQAERIVSVRVVGVSFNGPTACELTYRRDKRVTVSGGAEVRFFANDPTLMGVEGTLSNGMATLKVQPYRFGSPRLQARLWSPSGPLIDEQEIDEFDLRTTAARRIVIDRTMPDGTEVASARMLMDPYVPDLLLDMNIFVSGVTFDDSTLRRKVSTSGFVREEGDLWNGVSYRYGMIRAPLVTSGLCHSYVVFQDGVQVSY